MQKAISAMQKVLCLLLLLICTSCSTAPKSPGISTGNKAPDPPPAPAPAPVPHSTAPVASGMIAEYLINENGGSVLRDGSGNGNDATLGTSGRAPRWTAAGLLFSGAEYVALPLAVSNARTILLFGVLDQANSVGLSYAGMIASARNGSSFAAIVEAVNEAGTPSGILTFGSGLQASTMIGSGFSGPAVWAITTDATAGDTLYIDAVPLPFRNAEPVGTTLGNVAPGVWYLGGANLHDSEFLGSSWHGSINYAAFYNRALSTAEIGSETSYINALMSARGLATIQANRELGNQLTAIGDSLTQGLGSNNGYGDKPYTDYLTGLNLRYEINNIGIAGQSVAQIVVRQPMYGAYNNDPTAASSKNILWAGSNDFALISPQPTPATVWNELASICQNARALGQKTFVGTMVSRSSAYSSPPSSYDQEKNQLNSLILQYGDALCDGVVDFASFNPIGADAASNPQINPAYAPYWSIYDHIHLADAGYKMVAEMVQNRVNYADGATVSSPTVVSGNTYQVAARDAYLQQTITASATTTLPDCIGLTGLNFNISNVNTGGFVITVLPTETTRPQMAETISGAATVGANQTGVFQVTRGPLSTGGCGWNRTQ